MDNVTRDKGVRKPPAETYDVGKAADAVFEALMRREYVFLLDLHQEGTSSLVARTIIRLRAENVIAVKLDLQLIGASLTPEQWYAGLLMGIGQEMNLTTELFEYWSSNQAVGPLARWIGAMEGVALPMSYRSIVIFVCEVDFVRALPFSADELFAGVRDCYNRRSALNAFDRLTFCLVGVTYPGQLIRNPDITPFNVGTQIDLSKFS